jgi:hypothetical protein
VSIILILAEPCIDAQATSKVYSTANILLATESVFLVESAVKCSNNPKVTNKLCWQVHERQAVLPINLHCALICPTLLGQKKICGFPVSWMPFCLVSVSTSKDKFP